MNPTKEQEEIINCNENRISINALAGTGKTTTLYLYALKHSNEKMIYLCYNKSIAEENRGRFPKNVNVLTFH